MQSIVNMDLEREFTYTVNGKKAKWRGTLKGLLTTYPSAKIESIKTFAEADKN